MASLQGTGSFFAVGPPARIGETHPPIVSFLQQNIVGTTILDLGGGQGAYAHKLKQLGFEVTVADINPGSLQIAQQNGLKTKLLQPNESIEPNIVDTVVLIEVLEHVPNPKQFLQTAINAARKRVLFTIPCSNDFERLFAVGLSYAHIAVTDHLHHFTQQELHNLVASLGTKYQIELADPLFPHAAMKIIRDSFRWKWLGNFCLLPLRILNKYKGIHKDYYSRAMCVIEVDSLNT
jgi:SAM-dependent methyltransferase